MSVATTRQYSKRPIHESFAFQYFKKLWENQPPPKDEIYYLNDDEIYEIQRTKVYVLSLAALFGTSGVVFLYIPPMLFPDFFYVWLLHWTLPYFQMPVEIPIVYTLYGVFLAVAEIYALSLLNLYSVFRIAYVCGFPPKDETDYNTHINALFELGLEKPDKRLLAFGINPLQGLSQFALFMFSTFNILKATLSNLILKVVVARIFGRMALRVWIDLLGVPVFAFWNMYAANKIIREAKVRVMAYTLITQFANELYVKLGNNVDFRNTLFDCLQFIAITKRDFHYNHFLLAANIVKHFGKSTQKEITLKPQELLEKIEHIDLQAREGLIQLLIFGILIDGKLSRKEVYLLQRLQKEELINVSITNIKEWEQSFIKGRGMNGFFSYQGIW